MYVELLFRLILLLRNITKKNNAICVYKPEYG